MEQPGVVNAQMDVTDDDKLWSLLSWIFAPVIPLVVLFFLEDKKARPFIKYHAVQALVLTVVAYLVASVLVIAFIGCLLWPAALGYVIYLGVQAYQGNWVTIPIVTQFCQDQGWI